MIRTTTLDTKGNFADYIRAETHLQMGLEILKTQHNYQANAEQLVRMLVAGESTKEEVEEALGLDGNVSLATVASKSLGELVRLSQYPSKHFVTVEEDSTLAADIHLLQTLHFEGKENAVFFGYNGDGFFYSPTSRDLLGHLSGGKHVALFVRSADWRDTSHAAKNFGDDLAYLIGEHEDPLADVFPHSDYLRVTSTLPQQGKVKRYDFRNLLMAMGFEGKVGIRSNSDGKQIRIGARKYTQEEREAWAAEGENRRVEQLAMYRNDDPIQHDESDRDIVFYIPEGESFTVFMEKSARIRETIPGLYAALTDKMISSSTGSYPAIRS